jgi:hypothetical protein
MALLLLAFFAQATTSMVLKSPTNDEQFHIARAYAYTRTGELRLQQDHPPLVSVVSGLPLLLMKDLTPPQEIAGWAQADLYVYADQLLWRRGHPVERLVFLARYPIVLLGLTLGAFVFRWAREAHGQSSGLLAAGLFAFSPNLLAHTRLVTTDMAVTALGFIALYFHWRSIRKPTPARLLVAGLSAGLAIGSKQSALLLLPAILLLGLVAAWWAPASQGALRQRLLKALLWTGAVAVVAGLVLWALYGFELRPWPGTRIVVPATTHLVNVFRLLGQFEQGQGAFLMGEVSKTGWWYYFIVALALKTPLATIALALVSVCVSVRERRWRQEALLYLYPVAYFATTLATSLNIGYRHILPLVPYLCLYGSKAASLSWARLDWLRRWGLAVTMCVYCGVAVWLHPHYLAYFNLIAGGPDGGYCYLVDSNLDWGQDLKLLRDYLDENGIGEVSLAYNGTADPDYYGIEHRSLWSYGSSEIDETLAPASPEPGAYAISATLLQGPFLSNPDALDWFRHQQPATKIGYSIFVYNVPIEANPPSWLASCYAPVEVLSRAEVEQQFGRDDLRVVGFDCLQTWVIPGGGQAGWYLVPPSAGGPCRFADGWLGAAELVYRDRGFGPHPARTVYRSDARLPMTAVLAASEDWPACPLAAADSVADGQQQPDQDGAVAELLACNVSPRESSAEDAIVTATIWRVMRRPDDPNISLFAHLLDGSGAVSTGDALGFPAVQWVPGDVFIQRNTLDVPADEASEQRWVQVGLYSYVTGERLPVLSRGHRVSDQVRLAVLPAASTE